MPWCLHINLTIWGAGTRWPLALLLANVQVRPIMVTGDSAYCAHYIGRACGLIEEAADLLLADVDASGDVAWSFAGSRAQDNKLQVKMSTQQASWTLGIHMVQ